LIAPLEDLGMLQGIIPPIVTPMLSDESVDYPRMCQLIDRLIAGGVHGIFVLGTTGEFYALDDREKQEIMSVALAHVNGRVPVYAGTGAETTREAIRITKMAEKEGMSGVSIITPYFIMPNQNEIAAHYRRIAESTSLSVILYNNPATCGGLKTDVDTVARLAEIPNIIGIKDSSGDLQTVIEMVRAVPARFSVLQGRDTLIFSALQFGARGAIPASSNIAPELCVGIYNEFIQGNHTESQAYQLRLSPVRLALMMGTAPGVVKAALQAIGYPVGPSRSPIAPLSADKMAMLRSILQQANLVID